MRILFRNPDPGAGGGISSVSKLVEAYCGRFPGDRLTVMCAGESPLTALGGFANVEVELLPSGPGREIHRLAWAAHGVRRQLARASYDLVWCMNVGAYVRTAGPQVLSIQNAYQVYPWNLARHHPGARPRVAALRWFFRRSLGCADAAIVQTNLMREYVKAIPGCPRRVAVLPKAVVSSPDDAGQPLSCGLESALRGASGEVTALYAATHSPHKNHRLLAAMMEICRSRGISARLVVTLDAAQWSAAGGAGAESLVRSGHVILAGWVPKDQLRRLYTSVDFSVMPSLLESLSSAHLEAMQWRTPQIAADLPYARDLCGDAALYADPSDALAWVAQLERLRADAALRERLVSRGVERLKGISPATWNEMAERLRSVLAAVVKDSRNGSPAAGAAEETEFSAV
jgi:glycosyltransferase involved in cell wall biosynthesis